MEKVAYYKGCLASLSAKELDISTQALAPKVGLELVELESVTCCGAGDIHEAEPDYYLHLNARILAYAAAEGVDTLMTVCNVCTLNLRQANGQLKGDAELRARVNAYLATVGVPPYSGNVEVRHLLWEIAEGDGYEKLKVAAHKGLKGLKVAPF
ncbi:MAG TPA: heterodisulfide reductase-related iron-sulfur binding cluster, partial [Gaiellaceae bacterium]